MFEFSPTLHGTHTDWPDTSSEMSIPSTRAGAPVRPLTCERLRVAGQTRVTTGGACGEESSNVKATIRTSVRAIYGST